MSLVDRVKNILIQPKSEWEVIAGESPNPTTILTGYVIPLAFIPAVAMFIGYYFIGISVPFTGLAFRGFSWGLGYALQSFILTIAAVYITAFVVSLLAPSFGSRKDLGRAMQLVAYSYTPAWIAGILNIIPMLSILVGLISLYGIYLMYLGMPHTMETPKDKVVVYMIVSAIVLIVVYFILAAVLSSIIFSIFGLSMIGSL